MTAETSAFSVFVETPAEMQQLYLITWITTHLPTPEGWMAELAMLADG